MIDFQENPNGSAGFADYYERKNSGLYQRYGAFIGTDAAGVNAGVTSKAPFVWWAERGAVREISA
ncbi:MAG: hypothetical protein AAGG56_05585 [Pseudomonadota bacterium]